MAFITIDFTFVEEVILTHYEFIVLTVKILEVNNNTGRREDINLS